MKNIRGAIVFAILFVMFMGFVSITGAEENSSITGKATTQQATISIVVVGAPSLILHSPKNHSYFNATALFLNYTATNAVTVWYRLGNGTNITITTPLTFNVSFGSHTLFLFANSSSGLQSSKNVTFYVNASFFSISFGNFSGFGNTTNLTQYSFEELQNLTNVKFEKSYGKIFFGNQPINLTNSANSTYVNFDQYITISNNKIEINSSQLAGLNKSATLTLENLTFSDPALLVDGATCPSTICTLISYASGVLTFNVSHFTAYSSEETSSGTTGTTGGTTGGGGGGGSSTIKTIKDFSLNTEQISVKLRQGETKREEVIITNNGSQKIELSISPYKIEKFLKLETEKVILGPGASYTLFVDVLAEGETIPNLYIGKIIVSGGGITKEVLLAIEIVSKNPLMDVKVEIPDRFLHVKGGENIVASLLLYNLGRTNRIDAVIDYQIRNSEDVIVYTEQETIAVETQTSFLKTLKIPKSLPPGSYNLYVRATYGEQVASASAWFVVTPAAGGLLPIVFLSLVGLMIVFVIIVVFMLRRNKPRFSYSKSRFK